MYNTQNALENVSRGLMRTLTIRSAHLTLSLLRAETCLIHSWNFPGLSPGSALSRHWVRLLLGVQRPRSQAGPLLGAGVLLAEMQRNKEIHLGFSSFRGHQPVGQLSFTQIPPPGYPGPFHSRSHPLSPVTVDLKIILTWYFTGNMAGLVSLISLSLFYTPRVGHLWTYLTKL